MYPNTIFTLELASIPGCFCDFSFRFLRLWRTLTKHLMAEALNSKITLASCPCRRYLQTMIRILLWNVKTVHLHDGACCLYLLNNLSKTWLSLGRGQQTISSNPTQSTESYVVEVCKGVLQPAPSTCLLWDGNSRDHNLKPPKHTIITAITTSWHIDPEMFYLVPL